MKNWGYKFAYALKRTIRKQWKLIISQVFAWIGAIFTFSEILNNVFNNSIGYNFIRQYCIWFLPALLVICTLKNWQALKFTCFLKNTDVKVTLSVSNIFHQQGALVIPTNTTFDTLMEDEFISAQSVQGQYQIKYFNNALDKLDEKISASLKGQPYATLQDGRKTNKKRYDIGTTCKLPNEAKHTYWLALADINKYGKPENVTLETITSALVRLWSRLNEIGHLETLLMPLIGTGRAATKNASRDQIIQEIIFSFIVAAKEMKVTEHLVICIHPRDFAQKNLHWDEMCEYLEYTCKFMYAEKSATPEGIPEEKVVSTAI